MINVGNVRVGDKGERTFNFMVVKDKNMRAARVGEAVQRIDDVDKVIMTSNPVGSKVGKQYSDAGSIR